MSDTWDRMIEAMTDTAENFAGFTSKEQWRVLQLVAALEAVPHDTWHSYLVPKGDPPSIVHRKSCLGCVAKKILDEKNKA